MQSASVRDPSFISEEAKFALIPTAVFHLFLFSVTDNISNGFAATHKSDCAEKVTRDRLALLVLPNVNKVV